MSELPNCRLCGTAAEPQANGMLYHSCLVERSEHQCPLEATESTPEQWTALMGGGEAQQIGWIYRDRIGKPSTSLLSELKYRAFHEDPADFVPVYLHPKTAPAVDDAVLRDAARYRWLRRKVGACGPAGDDYSEWRFTFPTNFTLKVSELNVTDIESDFNNAIDTAMKGEG